MNTETDPYQRPDAPLDNPAETRYVGFWKRVLAAIVDSILIILVTMPILYAVYGTNYFTDTSFTQGPIDILMTYIFPAVAAIAFWVYRSATPGKMIVGAKIVDAETGGTVPVGRLIIRYVGYYVSTIALLLGFLWIAWDPRKQGWHDKMARTVVVSK